MVRHQWREVDGGQVPLLNHDTAVDDIPIDFDRGTKNQRRERVMAPAGELVAVQVERHEVCGHAGCQMPYVVTPEKRQHRPA